MQGPSKGAPARYVVLAIVFAVAVSFQVSVWAQDTSDLLGQPNPLAALLSSEWLLIVVLHGIAPLAALGLGFYVSFVRIEDRASW